MSSQKAIKQSLLDQLERKGARTPFFENLVDDYMALWRTKELLIRDIKKNGIRIKYDNGGGQSGEKDNPSIAQQVRVNAQMLKILAQLGITTDDIAGGAEDEL